MKKYLAVTANLILVIAIFTSFITEDEKVSQPDATKQKLTVYTSVIQYITLAYNIKKISQPPKDYEDILKPEYAYKSAFEIDSMEWEKALLDQLGEDYFYTLKTKLDNQEIRGVDGNRFLTELLVSGEVSIAINLPNNFTEDAKAIGAPVEWIPLEPVVAHPQTAALLSHSEQGKRLINFLLSKEGQLAVLEVGRGAPVDESQLNYFYLILKNVPV